MLKSAKSYNDGLENSLKQAIKEADAGLGRAHSEVMAGIRRGLEEVAEAKKSGKKSQSLSDFLKEIED